MLAENIEERVNGVDHREPAGGDGSLDRLQWSFRNRRAEAQRQRFGVVGFDETDRASIGLWQSTVT